MANVKEELFASLDIECDSGYGSPYSANMWQIGISFVDRSGTEIDHFESLIQTDPRKKGDPRTLAWLKAENLWDKYSSCSSDIHDSKVPYPKEVMNRLGELLLSLSEKYRVVFVAYPAAYDFMYFKTYYDKYVEILDAESYIDVEKTAKVKDLVGYSAKCMSTLFSTICTIKGIARSDTKAFWDNMKGVHEHTHDALDDAREQGHVYIKLLDELDRIRRIHF